MAELKRSDAMRSRRRRAVGETRVARDFFAGRYAQVVARTFDGPGEAFAGEDVAFAVGALTFLGRREDAQACFDAWRMRASALEPRTVAASRFFLGLSQARAGKFAEARELLVAGVRPRLKEGDAWSEAFSFQGLAAYRYFTGRYHAAARHALRALRAAHAAGFAYVKLLANDLRGHALVQVGRLAAGTVLLEQARRLASELGLELNAFAIDCSIASYSLKFGFESELLGRLEALLSHPAHDSYSRHGLLIEYAGQLALRGRGSEARLALAQADQAALQRDVRRAKLSNLLAHLHVTRFTEGLEACAAILDQAQSLVEPADVAFRAELAAFAAELAHVQRDSGRFHEALAELRALAKSHDLHWAKAALQRFGSSDHQPLAFAEDRRTPLLRAVFERNESSLARLLAARFYGAIPELFGVPPGRRIWVLVDEDALLLEDHGDVTVRQHPPSWCPLLLSLLASGDVSKETLVARLWGLKLYRPERHDPLIRTTIHRLRAFIEPYAAWVKVTTNGYGTGVPLQFVGGMPTAGAGPAELEDFALDENLLARPVPAPKASRTSGLDEKMLGALTAGASLSVEQIAKACGVSSSTALRGLRRLLAARRVTRSGFARATRYRLLA